MTNPMTPSTNPARDEASELILVRRDMIASACHALRTGDNAPKTLEYLREASLAAAPAPASGVDAVKAALDADSGIAAFERWAQPAGYLMHLYEGPNSERRYLYASTDNAWLAWCASRSALSPAATSGSEAGGVAVAWRWRYDGEKAWGFRKSKPDEWPDVEMQPLYLAKPSSPAGGGVVDSVALSIDSDMRNSDFETWACKRGYLMHLHEGDESRRYRYSLTEEAWLGWCAALESSHDR